MGKTSLAPLFDLSFPEGRIKWGPVTVVYRVELPGSTKIFGIFERNIGEAIAAQGPGQNWPREAEAVVLRWWFHNNYSAASISIRIRTAIDGRDIAAASHLVGASELRGEDNPYIDIFGRIAETLPDAYARWVEINKRKRKYFSVMMLGCRKCGKLQWKIQLTDGLCPFCAHDAGLTPDDVPF